MQCAALQVSVLGACLGEPSQACLIMELVEGGSLAARIHDRKKRRLTYVQILQASPSRVPSTIAAQEDLTIHDCNGGVRASAACWDAKAPTRTNI
jgi:hypothetical protein